MNHNPVSVAEVGPIIIARDQPDFVQTPRVKEIADRALLYLGAGLPVHFSGPAGTGKTTLAMYIAAQIGRPVILLHGDEEFGTSDLVGGGYGFRRRATVDNYIHSVLKSEEDVQLKWVDNRVTVACRHGFTLLYDEFTRSRPETNNVLLSVLGERILDLPAERGDGNAHLRVDPDFRAIFTSNPHEYAGVHRAQDALRDRLITINLGHYDRETEIAITCAKSGIAPREAEKIVSIIRDFRQTGSYGSIPSVRACINIAKVVAAAGAEVSADNEVFVRACLDVLGLEAGRSEVAAQEPEAVNTALGLIRKHCQRGGVEESTRCKGSALLQKGKEQWR